MKYSPEIYAKALAEVSKSVNKSEENKILKNFAALLFKNGDAAFADKVLRAVKKELVKRSGGRNVEIVLARDVSGPLQTSIKDRFSPKDDILFSYNRLLVAGTRITVDGSRELNNSFQYRLNQMFS